MGTESHYHSKKDRIFVRALQGQYSLREELARLRATHKVTQAMVFEGTHRARLFAPDGAPPPGFEPSAATLEDFYLALVRGWIAPAGLVNLGATAAAR